MMGCCGDKLVNLKLSPQISQQYNNKESNHENHYRALSNKVS